MKNKCIQRHIERKRKKRDIISILVSTAKMYTRKPISQVKRSREVKRNLGVGVKKNENEELT